jgi:hypothetical protein
MWIEIDADGDSTFILNANAIDITKSTTNPIVDFDSGEFTIEAAVFGFDRGSFDLNGEFRLVMTRPNTTNGWNQVGGSFDPEAATRAQNTNNFVVGPTALLPGPATPADEILINYSRTPYQGDAWGSQTNYIDIPYAPGPLTSGTAYEIASTNLDQDGLTRPNEKPLEILAATSFATSLGTGRYSGDIEESPLSFTHVASEDETAYPPTSGADPRPLSLPETFDIGGLQDAPEIGTEYLGSTERLPLGALFRDKDLYGQRFGYTVNGTPFMYSDTVGNGDPTGLQNNSDLDQHDIQLNTATSGVGSPGDVLVHVDGEQGDYSLLTNYRTTRGGSVFVASGPRPGGSLSFTNPLAYGEGRVVQGRAFLVRNAVTNVGANEVSAGNELMLLIVTGVFSLAQLGGDFPPSTVSIGTNGTGEGYSAADLYRIEGHPLVRNNIRMNIDPANIELVRK